MTEGAFNWPAGRVADCYVCSVRVWRPRWGAWGDYFPFTRDRLAPRLIVASLQRREREAGRTSPR